jgi:5-methylthioribose kinase
MEELTPATAVKFAQDRGWLPLGQAARAEALAYGVSNLVVRVMPETGDDLVLKQSREKLRVQADWRSRLDRIYREIDALAFLNQILPAGSVPRLLAEDRENYAFAMEALPANHRVWKGVLLAGEANGDVAARLGGLLATVHSATSDIAPLVERFGDLTVFDELRLDPFYRYVARQFPEAAPALESLVAESLAARYGLVLADFSPKNVLLVPEPSAPPTASGAVVERVVLVDFETAHLGDPAFDLGFFLSHLVLKAVRFVDRFHEYAFLTYRFWDGYRAVRKQASKTIAFVPAMKRPALFARTLKHFAACLWARLDGKSPVDYLPEEPRRRALRNLARQLLCEPVLLTEWEQVLASLRLHLAREGLG